MSFIIKKLSHPHQKAYLRSCIALVLLRALDLILTYHYTPHLTEEWNPAVKHFETGWNGLIGIQVVIVSFIIFLAYFYYSRPSLKSFPKGLNKQQFIYYFFAGKRSEEKLKKIQFSKDLWLRHLGRYGFILLNVAIIFSSFAVVNNALVLSGVHRYTTFIAEYGHIFFPALIALNFILVLFLFFYGEYHAYQYPDH